MSRKQITEQLWFPLIVYYREVQITIKLFKLSQGDSNIVQILLLFPTNENYFKFNFNQFKFKNAEIWINLKQIIETPFIFTYLFY